MSVKQTPQSRLADLRPSKAEVARRLWRDLDLKGVSIKGTVEKKVLAGWSRQQTAAQRQWVCERSCMGEVSAVT